MDLNDDSPRALALALIQRVFARIPDGVHTFANAVRDATGDGALPDRAAVARSWGYLEDNGLIAPVTSGPTAAWVLTEDGHRVLRSADGRTDNRMDPAPGSRTVISGS